MNYRALCNDCLREHRFSDAQSFYAKEDINGIVDCSCGGELCDCPSCVATLDTLSAGARGQVPEIHGTVLDWTPDGGAVFARPYAI